MQILYKISSFEWMQLHRVRILFVNLGKNCCIIMRINSDQISYHQKWAKKTKLPEAVICARISRYKDTASIWRWPHSLSPTTIWPVEEEYLACNESDGFWDVLNFSTFSFCCIIAISSPRINFTQLCKIYHNNNLKESNSGKFTEK